MKSTLRLIGTVGIALIASTSAFAYSGGVDSDTASVSSLADAELFATAYRDASLARHVADYVDAFSSMQSFLGPKLMSVFQGSKENEDVWGHRYQDGTPLVTSTYRTRYGYSGQNVDGVSDSSGWGLDTFRYKQPEATFTYGTLASDALTPAGGASVQQQLWLMVHSQVVDLVARVGGGTVSYSATLNWDLSGGLQAFTDAQATTSIGHGFGRAGSRTIDLGTYATLSTPGPIVGAGIPALLGFAGFGAWRRRRAAA